MNIGGIEVHPSLAAVKTSVTFDLVCTATRRRKRWTVERHEHHEPCAYRLNGAALSIPGFPVRDVLVVHPSLLSKLHGADAA